MGDMVHHQVQFVSVRNGSSAVGVRHSSPKSVAPPLTLKVAADQALSGLVFVGSTTGKSQMMTLCLPYTVSVRLWKVVRRQ